MKRSRPLVNGPRSLAARRVALLAFVLAPLGRAQAVKLNDTLARTVGGDVIDYRITPGGDRVLLRADATRKGVYELFSAPAQGNGATVRLNGPLPPNSDVGGAGINVFGAGGGWDYDASSTGRVVFLLDLVNDIDELYSVPADGSGPMIRLNGALAPGERVQKFWILPDGREVVYLARQLGEVGLFRVPIDGSRTPTAITPGVVPYQFWFSRDGGVVAYTLPLEYPDRTELWSVPTDGSTAPIRLAITRRPPSLGITWIDRVDLSDDGTFAVYRDVMEYIDDPVDANLDSVPLDGSTSPIQLNAAPLSPYEDYTFDGIDHVVFREPIGLVSVSLDGTRRAIVTPSGWIPEDAQALVAADGNDVVFAARSGFTGGLFRAPLDGSWPAQLLATGSRIRSFQLAPTCAIFTTFDAASEFVAVPLAGGATRILNPTPFDEGAFDWRIHPDGDELWFRAQPGGTGMVQLYSVPIDGKKLPRQLNAPLIAAGDVERYTFSDDGKLVVYRADQFENEALEVFGLPSPFHRVVTYGPPLAPGAVVGDVQSFRVSADESRLLYRADQDIGGVFGLYLTTPDGRVPPRSLTALLDEHSTVYTGYAFTPDAGRAVFLQADSPGSASGRLISIATSLSAASAPLVLDNRGGVRAQQLVVDPTSQRVVYRRGRTLLGSLNDLCSARVDGTEPALTLTPPSGDVSTVRLTPDGTAAIYLADHDRTGVIELYRVPLDGSAPAFRLHPALRGTADVEDFALTPDGENVVFVADLAVNDQEELYVVPSDGSTSPVRRSSSPVPGGDVTDFVVTPPVAPIGSSVVYREDQRVDGTFELFSFAVAGGPDVDVARVPDGRSVEPDFAVSKGGRFVVYRADANAPGVFELFRAPVDGSALPIRLSGPLATGGGVDAFELARDARRVVYLADQRVRGVHELWSVPLVGGTPTLLEPLPPKADVTDFRIAPDSDTVFFRADASTDEVYELFGVPIEGGIARLVTLRLAPYADVLPDFLPLSNGRAIHRVDQEQDGVLELYAGYLDHSYRSAQTPTSKGRR